MDETIEKLSKEISDRFIANLEQDLKKIITEAEINKDIVIISEKLDHFKSEINRLEKTIAKNYEKDSDNKDKFIEGLSELRARIREVERFTKEISKRVSLNKDILRRLYVKIKILENNLNSLHEGMYGDTSKSFLSQIEEFNAIVDVFDLRIKEIEKLPVEIIESRIKEFDEYRAISNLTKSILDKFIYRIFSFFKGIKNVIKNRFILMARVLYKHILIKILVAFVTTAGASFISIDVIKDIVNLILGN